MSIIYYTKNNKNNKMNYEDAVKSLINAWKKGIVCEAIVDDITLKTTDIKHDNEAEAREDLRIAYCNGLASWINRRANNNDAIQECRHHR